MEKIMRSEWHSKEHLLITKISGKLNKQDIESWRNSLLTAMSSIPAKSTFKMLVDLYGFEADNMEVHKEFRTIIPSLLADYNYRIDYLDMFPEATVELKRTRGISCIAMANVHHNAEKMSDYQTRFGKYHEQYFTESEAALSWIRNLTLNR
jgi:hypothetical protein